MAGQRRPLLANHDPAMICSIDWLYFLAAISRRAFASEWSGAEWAEFVNPASNFSSFSACNRMA